MTAKSAVVALALLAAGAAAAPLTASDEQAFAAFTAKYARVYKGPEETAFRKRVFAKNMKRIASMQSRNPLATFGVNAFADRTPTERGTPAAREHFRRVAAAKKDAEPVADLVGLTAAPRVDWRETGVVPEAARDQGLCASHWAFAAVSNIESAWAKAKNTTVVPLSEEEFSACDTRNRGCNGGVTTEAFEWLLEARDGWISTHESYPYEASFWGEPDECKGNATRGARITGYKELPKNETQIAQFVSSNHPVVVTIDAEGIDFYWGGIVTECPSVEATHQVNIVGYDDTHTPPYWIVRNSWGANWGEKGYFRVEKGTNQCLIQEMASTVIVA